MKIRLIVFLLIIIVIGTLTACSRLSMLDFETNRDEKQYREVVDKVFLALDSKNKEDLKKLFALNVINKNLKLDSQIDELLEFYKGPKESDEGVRLVHSEPFSVYSAIITNVL